MVMRSPGRNHPHAAFAECVRHKKNTSIDFANRLSSFFAIIASPIDALNPSRIRKDPGCLREADAVLGKVGRVLGRVPLEVHGH